MVNFADKLAAAVRRCGNPVLVGLDPRWEQLPPSLRNESDGDPWQCRAEAYRAFCCGVIDVVAPLVSAVKPQAAFFEQLGPVGLTSLASVMNHAQDRGLLVILDGKRNDIGTTARAYAEGYLGDRGVSPWGADAMTVSPYLGDDSLEPFVEVCSMRGCGIFALVKTSNPGGGVFQDLSCDGRPLYRHVGDYIETLARGTRGECGYGAVGAVVGATYSEQLQELRSAMPHTWFLVPGYGAQGGSALDVAPAFDSQGLGAIVNNSRGIIFAHSRKEYAQFGERRWQEAIAAATRAMIDELRAVAPPK
jgi:orotidine-5'-phosphate decarboxylase